jgi:hypothetical protein
MRYPTPAKNSGQALVECVVSLSILSTALGALLILILQTCAWSFVRLDSFLLARAHLYGQRLERCKVSTLWPQNRYLKVEYQCHGGGSIQIRTNFMGQSDWEL